MITSSPAIGETIFKGGTPMASNYTEQYKLCQWEETDAVLRTDFNEDNAKIEAAFAAMEENKADYSIAMFLATEIGRLNNQMTDVLKRLDTLEGK